MKALKYGCTIINNLQYIGKFAMPPKRAAMQTEQVSPNEISGELLLPDLGRAFTLSIDLGYALRRQVERLVSKQSEDDFQQRLSAGLAHALTYALDPDLQPPSPAQLRYVQSIAKHLSLPLPSDAVHFKEKAAAFIAEHKGDYHRVRTAEFQSKDAPA